MQSKLAIFSATILLSLISLAQAQTNENAPGFTLQVASFPDTALAENFAAKLARAGEPTGWGTVELPGRGYWTRVFVGSFKTIGAARGYGDALVARGIVAEYLVKTAYDVKSLSRPRTVSISTGGNPVTEKKKAVLNSTVNASVRFSPLLFRATTPRRSTPCQLSCRPI